MATEEPNSGDWHNEKNSFRSDQSERERKRRERLLSDSKSYSNGDAKRQQESENPLDQFLNDPRKSLDDD